MKNLFWRKVLMISHLLPQKLINGKKNLEKLLGSKKQSLSNYVLGYNPFSTKKTSKTIFVKQGFSKDDACSYCGVNDHYAYSCKLRQSKFVGVKIIWVPKGTILPNLVITNQKGSKKVWVPISKFWHVFVIMYES